jgi:hypothetical protein
MGRGEALYAVCGGRAGGLRVLDVGAWRGHAGAWHGVARMAWGFGAWEGGVLR